MFCILKRVVRSPMLAESVKAGIHVLMRERGEKEKKYSSFICTSPIASFAKAKAPQASKTTEPHEQTTPNEPSARSMHKQRCGTESRVHYMFPYITYLLKFGKIFSKKWRSSVLLAVYKTTV